MKLEAAKKIKKILKIFLAMRKRNLWLTLESTVGNGNGNNGNGNGNGCSVLGGSPINISNSFRKYGSSETYGSAKSNTTKNSNLSSSCYSTNSNGNSTNRSRKRTESSTGSPTSHEKDGEKDRDRDKEKDGKKDRTVSKPVRYFTTKGLKVLANKLLGGKPKSPLTMQMQQLLEGSVKNMNMNIVVNGITSSGSSKNILMDSNNNSSNSSKSHYSTNTSNTSHNNGNNNGNNGNNNGNNSNNNSINNSQSSRFSDDTTVINTKNLTVSKYKKNVTKGSTNSLAVSTASSSPVLSRYTGDTAEEIRYRRNSQNSVNSSENGNENSIFQSVSNSMKSNLTSFSVSGSSIHDQRENVTKELKERHKQNQRDLRRIRKECSLKIMEDSFCLVTQKAYCLVSSEADHSALFQVLS